MIDPGSADLDARAPSLLLVGHGSHLSGGSSAPVRQLARELIASAAFGEVRVTFWKEEPGLRHAFDLVEGQEVYVVPVFTSQGYFTDEVLPREMGIGPGGEASRGRRVHWCPPVGTHPEMKSIALLRLEEVLEDSSPAEAVVVVVGHGTGLNPQSGDTTLSLVESLREEGLYRDVVPAFLDQEPTLDDVLDGIEAPEVVVLPFFIAEGWHAGTTIPRDLALDGGRTIRAGTSIRYARPLGTHPAMAGVVRAIVRDAQEEGESESGGGGTGGGVQSSGARPGPRGTGEAAPPSAAGPAAGMRQRFLDRLPEPGGEPVTFLQAVILPMGDGTFEVRHVDDLDVEGDALETSRDPVDADRFAEVTDEGAHRPLRTSPDLRMGWRLAGLSEKGVWEAFCWLYPGAPVHRELAREGRLTSTSFRECAVRQTGIYAGLEVLPDESVRSLAHEVCAPGRCLRTPAWEPARPGPGPGDRDLDVPCPEPCSIFITAARRRKRQVEEGGRG